MVTDQLVFSSFDTRFRTMLDSELFLTESWNDDRPRCCQAGVLDEVVYRPKHTIAMESLDLAQSLPVCSPPLDSEDEIQLVRVNWRR